MIIFSKKAPKMKDQKLQLSPVVAGTMNYGLKGSELSVKQVSNLIYKAMETGITTFDMADIYGDYTTEALFGKAWKTLHIPRDKVQFITKTNIKAPNQTRKEYLIKHYNSTAQHIRWSVENSLKALHTDYLDLLLIHRPDPLMNPTEIAGIFKTLKKEGKVNHFGVSNFTPSQFGMLNQEIPLFTNQVEISLLYSDRLLDGTLDQCLQNHIQPMAWSPLGGYFSRQGKEITRTQKVLTSLKVKYQASEAQLLISWLLKHPAQIIPVLGTTKPERIKESWEAQKINLERQDWFALWEAARGFEVP
jgi:predicted oxidoreductase